jgi:hypothetical protein
MASPDLRLCNGGMAFPSFLSNSKNARPAARDRLPARANELAGLTHIAHATLHTG